MGESIINVSGVSKVYPGGAGIFNVNINIDKNGVYGLLGENGAGKSTLMSIMTGYMSPTSGNVSICGHDMFKEPVKAKSNIGYLPDTVPVYDDMTVWEYLNFVAQLRGIKKSDRMATVNDVLEKTNLDEVKNRLIRNLSKGFRQRVGLAQAIIAPNKLLILDEPTNGLDPAQIAETRAIIESLKEDRVIILSSHILSEIEGLCEDVFIMSKGNIIFNGKLFELEKDGMNLEEAFLQIISKNNDENIDTKGDDLDDSDI